MWWDVEDGEGLSLVAALDRLAEQPATHLHGFGIAYIDGGIVPLLIAPVQSDPRPALIAPGRGPLSALVRLGVRMIDLPLPDRAIESPFDEGSDSANDDRAGRLARRQRRERPRAVRTFFGLWRKARKGETAAERGITIPLLPADTRSTRIAAVADLPGQVVVSYRAEFQSTGIALRGRRRRPIASTGLGVAVRDHPRWVNLWRGRAYFGTVGHLGIDIGEPVFTGRTGLSLKRKVRLGSMAWKADPTRPPQDPYFNPRPSGAVDFALCVMDPNAKGAPVVRTVVAEDVDEGDLCEWTGARSGTKRGDVVGALRSSLRLHTRFLGDEGGRSPTSR